MTSRGPTISVIIPTYNAKRTIAACLASLLSLDYPDYEVIFVDDGSTDGTPDSCESSAGVRVIRLDKGGPSRARNVGVKASRGEIAAFTDSDCIAPRNWLTELASGFDDPRIAGVGGDQKSPDDESDFGRAVQDFFKKIGFLTEYIKTGDTLAETLHNPSCNSAYRKTVLEEAGGFDEAQFPGEDIELDLKIRRLGYSLVYNPRAVVAHYRPGSHSGVARMMWRYGWGEGRLFKKYGLYRKIDYIPFLLLSALLPAASLLIAEPRVWPAFVLPAPVLFSWFLLTTGKLAESFRFTVLFAITLISWNLGFFSGVLRGFRR